MPCEEFESLLLEFDRLSAGGRRAADEHLAGCEECRAWFEALAEVDAALAGPLAGMHAPSRVRAAVLRRVRQEARAGKVSRIPELLDLIGWSAVAAALGVLLYQFQPAPEVATIAARAAAGSFLAAGLWFAVRSLRDLTH